MLRKVATPSYLFSKKIFGGVHLGKYDATRPPAERMSALEEFVKAKAVGEIFEKD